MQTDGDHCSARSIQSDGLEEYGGDFRRYERPDAAAVADIMERRRRMRPERPEADAPPSKPDEPGSSPVARSDTATGVDIDAVPVRFSSMGRTLVVGRDAGKVEACGRRLAHHQMCLTVVEEGADAPPRNQAGEPLRAKNLIIGGYLGRFEASAELGGRQTRLSRLLEGSPACFDLVLDLRPASRTSQGPLPAGYYLPGEDELELERALDELPLMIGVFEKPRFVTHDRNRCAHVGAEPEACARCPEVCPVDALRSFDGRIQIDHAACVECGLCATVCPTGAMRCLHDSPQDLLVAVKGRLSERGPDRKTAPTVVFHQAEAGGDGPGQGENGERLSIPVAHIGCVGPEVWLGALAYGAGRVVLRLPEFYPDSLAAVLEGERKWADALLAELGLSADRIRLEAAGDSEKPHSDVPAEGSFPAEFPPFQSKRALVLNSAAHLAVSVGRPPDPVRLPPGTPFGDVRVDPSACTLCMACVGACPTAALTAAGNVPSLSLVEIECIQCGRCRETCPEEAVALDARIMPHARLCEMPRQLHAREPIACISCGKPFAAPGMVQKMIERLEGHWMYSSEKDIRRLKMCRDCRVRDFFTEQYRKGAP